MEVGILLKMICPNRICIPNKTDYVNLNVITMITRINKSKQLTTYIWYDCKCEFDSRKCNSNWN